MNGRQFIFILGVIITLYLLFGTFPRHDRDGRMIDFVVEVDE